MGFLIILGMTMSNPSMILRRHGGDCDYGLLITVV